MPYVPLAPVAPEARAVAAERRWAALLSTRPELQPAVTLQRELLTIVAELAAAFARGRIPKLSLPPKYLAAKIFGGVPVLTGEPIPVPVAMLKPALIRFCDALGRGGAGDTAANIRRQLDETRMEAGSLLTASLKRDQKAIRTGATSRGLAPDLLWLIAELAVSPFVDALQRAILGAMRADSPVRHALDQWRHGLCPFCSSWPALAEVADTHRVLRCSFCAFAWELDRYACVYCGEDGERFVTAAPDDERRDRRLELCNTCGAYLKTVEVPELSPFPLLAISDLETMDLDMAAMERKYGRPALKDFAHR